MRLSALRPRLLAAVACLALFAVACLPGTSGGGDDEATDKSGPVTVEFWTINLKKNFGEYVQGLIDSYEKTHPQVTIEWVDVPGGDMSSKLLAALASGDVPDAVNIENFAVPQFTDTLADLSTYLDDEALSDYSPELLDSVTVDDKVLALPWYHAGAPISWCNKSILRKAGMAGESLPATWDEAFTFGKKVHDETGVYGMISQPPRNAMPSVDVLLSYDVQMLSDDHKKAAFDTPEVAKIWEDWKRAYKNGAIAPGVVAEDQHNPPETVKNKQAACVMNGLPAELVNVEANAPDVYKQLVLGKAATGPSGTYVIPGFQSFVVPKKSEVKKQAADFIAFVSNGKNQLAFTKLTTIYPSTLSTLKDPYFADVKGGGVQDRARKLVVESVPKVRTASMGTTKDTELAEAYLKQYRTYLRGNRPAADVLDETAKQWDDMLGG